MLPIIIALVSFLALATIIGQQILLVRRGVVSDRPENVSPTFAHQLGPQIESTARGLTLVGHRAGHGLYLQTLLILRHLVSWFKVILHKLEHRVSTLISSARVDRGRLSRSELHRERGAVSFFLAQIKDHQNDFKPR